MIVFCSVAEECTVEATVVVFVCGVEVVESGSSETVLVLVSVEFATVDIDEVNGSSLVVVDVEGSIVVALTAEVTESVSDVDTGGDVDSETSLVVVSNSVVFIVSIFTVVVVKSRVVVAASEEEVVSEIDGVVIVEASDFV